MAIAIAAALDIVALDLILRNDHQHSPLVVSSAVRLVAHRSNFSGPGSGDNRPDAIAKCRDLGFDAEVDVWGVANGLWIGHDGPTWECDPDMLRSPHVWAHAKNIAGARLLQLLGARFFCLDRGDFALCSTGELWTNYGSATGETSIVLQPRAGRCRRGAIELSCSPPDGRRDLHRLS